jgi:hypothetical protein
MNKYQYKVVLVCPMASAFRGNDLEYVKEALTRWKTGEYQPAWLRIKDASEMDYCFKLRDTMATLEDYTIRIEHPWINFYTNNTKHVEKVTAIDSGQVKYVSLPCKTDPELKPASVIVRKLDYDFKVHMGKTLQNHSNFVAWAEKSNKIRLTKRAKSDLSKNRSWGGSYFYVRDEKSLTMVKVFLGGEISKIESVIKA